MKLEMKNPFTEMPLYCKLAAAAALAAIALMIIMETPILMGHVQVWP